MQRKEPADAHSLRPVTSAQGQAGWVMGQAGGRERGKEREGERVRREEVERRARGQREG